MRGIESIGIRMPVDLHVVPCNGCTACCRNDMVRLLPADDPAQYRTEPHPYRIGELMLAHKPNGECIYLTATGCGIHDTSPEMCRVMDCRRIAEQIGYTQARKLGIVTVWRKGKALAHAD